LLQAARRHAVANIGGNQLWVDSDLVEENGISCFQDLLNPNWEGELQDPRVSGNSYTKQVAAERLK
jgi:hypothetical protein